MNVWKVTYETYSGSYPKERYDDAMVCTPFVNLDLIRQQLATYHFGSSDHPPAVAGYASILTAVYPGPAIFLP